MYYQLTLDKDSRNQYGLQYAEVGEKEYIVNLGRYEASYPQKYIEYVKLGADGHLRTYWHNVDIHFLDIFSQECLHSQNGYLVKEVRNCTFSNISNASAAIISKIKKDGCKQACLQNCSCGVVVFSYEITNVAFRNSYMSSEIFITGDTTTIQTQSLAFVKILNTNVASRPSPREDIPNVHVPSLPSGQGKNIIISIATNLSIDGIVKLFVDIFFFYTTFLQLMTWKKDHKDIKQVPGMLLSFFLKTWKLQLIILRKQLGTNGTIIVVKRLNKMSQEIREFLAEVETMGRLHHFNLARLVGFYAETSCRLLVNEYMTNGF